MTAGNVVVGPDWTPPEPSKIPWPPKGGERGCRPGLVVISELVETRLGINFTFQELLFRPVRSSFFSQAARDVRGDRDRVLTLRAAVGLIPENRPSPLLVSPPCSPRQNFQGRQLLRTSAWWRTSVCRAGQDKMSWRVRVVSRSCLPGPQLRIASARDLP